MHKIRFLLQYSGANCNMFWIGIAGKMITELLAMVIWLMLFIFIINGLSLPSYIMLGIVMTLIIVQWFISKTAKQSFIGAYHITHQLRTKVLTDLRKQPLSQLVGKGLGEKMKQITTDLKLFEDILSHLIAEFFAAWVIPFSMLICIGWISLTLALTLFLMMVTACAVLLLSENKFSLASQHNHHKNMEAADKLFEYITCLPMLKSFGNAERLAKPLNEKIEQVRQAGLNVESTGALGVMAATLVLELSLPLMMIIAANLVYSNTITSSEWLAVIVATIASVRPLARLTLFSALLRYFFNSAFRLHDLVTAPQQKQDGQQPKVFDIELENVELTLNQEIILHSINLKVAQGEHIAIIGPSGSGKSSLLHIIAAFHSPTSGQIRIGGLPLSEIGTQHLYSQLSYVTQDVQLFSGSLKDNLLIASPLATKNELDHAITSAGLEPLRQRLTNGINSEIGENGDRLSGGERQRLSIARAILHDTPIILLDEITSALDTATQEHVMTALKQLCKGKTVITIAHRLDTIVDADQIYLLENGHISVIGQHKHLLQHPFAYQHLSQAS